MLQGGSHPLIDRHRASALAQLKAEGLPSRKVERYKYTDVRAMLEPDFGLNFSRLPLRFDPRSLYRCKVPGLGSTLHYVVGDMVEHKTGGQQDGSFFVGSMTEFAKRRPELFSTYYNKVGGDSLAALNTMLVQDGLVIWIGKGHKADNLIQVVNLSVGSVPMMANRRQLIIMEEGAEASILCCNHSSTAQPHLATEVVEAFLGEGSHLQYYQIEDSAEASSLLGTANFVQQGASRLDYASVTLSGGTSRRTVNVSLEGVGADLVMSGLVIADGSQHTDNNLLVTHCAPGCHSDMLYKYILDGSSTGAFAGKVMVRPGAQQTDSQQTNANLCVSPQAHMYTQPMLEIYADDVKCNHGSTVGQMDEAALFYMAQRGIGPDEGRLLLQQAFAWDVVLRIGLLPLRQRLMSMVEERFRRGTSLCGDCAMCQTPNS